MVTISVAEGVGRGPTRLAAFDAALADIGAERYNLVMLSSVIPSDATLVGVDDLSALGVTGDRLYAVQAVASVPPQEVGAAGLGWSLAADGRGIFYEATATGADATAAVTDEIDTGLEAGVELRGWRAVERDAALVEAGPSTHHGCALVLAAYGDAVGW